jgi:hypothetical protein
MGQRSIIIAIALIIFAVILGVLFVVSRLRSGGNDNTEPDVPVVSEESNTIRVTDVVNDPNVYNGITIEVQAPVTDWITKRTFLVSNTAETGGLFNSTRNEYLLAYRDRDFRLPTDTPDTGLALGETGDVKIKGKVRIVTAKELAELLGVGYNEEEGRIEDANLILDDYEIEDWVRGSIIIIDSVEKAQ